LLISFSTLKMEALYCSKRWGLGTKWRFNTPERSS
jgi:hypothetical protein